MQHWLTKPWRRTCAGTNLRSETISKDSFAEPSFASIALNYDRGAKDARFGLSNRLHETLAIASATEKVSVETCPNV